MIKMIYVFIIVIRNIVMIVLNLKHKKVKDINKDKKLQ